MPCGGWWKAVWKRECCVCVYEVKAKTSLLVRVCVCVNVQLRKRGAKISPKSQHERNKKTTIIPFQWVSRGKVIKTEPTPNLLAEKKNGDKQKTNSRYQLSLWGNGFYLVGPCDAESRLDVDAVTNCMCVCTLTSAVAATRYSLFTCHSHAPKFNHNLSELVGLLFAPGSSCRI